MPKFIFNKLVRDKLRDEYKRMGQVATYRKLSKTEHIEQIKLKVIEEVSEIPVDGPIDDIVGEIADVQQAIDDLKVVHGVSDEQISEAQRKKFDKKGGFSGATFVETVEIKDDDPWIGYYRENPEKFVEVTEE